MSKFIVKKRVPLDFLGEEWKDCYIEFQPFSPKDLITIDQMDTTDASKGIQAMSEMITLLESHFIGGKGYTGSGLADIEATDLQELPLEALQACIKAANGAVSPN